jgi:hypothetical protein
MHKFTLALAAMAFLAGAGGARADDSGHIGINSLNAELPSPPRRIARPARMA